MIPQFFLLALGTLVSEDLTCIAAGALIAQGKIGFLEGVLACLAGIFSGDILLFLAGRFFGRPALERPIFRRFLSPEKVERASKWLERRGLTVVFVSRFTPGLRLATYFAAGSLRTRFWSFGAYFLLASAVWTPLLVGSTVLFGGELLKTAFAHGNQGFVAFASVCLPAAVLFPLCRDLFTFEGRRKLVGSLKRKIRWEFWPPWAAYLPLAPYIVYLGIKHRSLTLFTAANPGIPSGGFVGESKSQILRHLGDAAAEFEMAEAGNRFEFPVVLKPDVGERGAGVAVIRSQPEFDEYLRQHRDTTIIQRYVDGVEFGVFYYRYPDELRGRIFSITEKRFPEVTGDGRSTLSELILRDSRAVCMAAAYEKVNQRKLDEIPQAGERIRLVELGSHCRGAVFLDGSRFKTEVLEQTIDKVAQSHPGFFFGRFDVRTPSPAALQEGVFTVIELNGVSSEATHVYDPAVSLFEAYRIMFTQWRIAFEIGAANRARGATPLSVSGLLRLILNPFKNVLTKDRAASILDLNIFKSWLPKPHPKPRTPAGGFWKQRSIFSAPRVLTRPPCGISPSRPV